MTLRHGIDLAGLSMRPAQVWGAIRLVPLVRDRPIDDLRLHPCLYGEDRSSVHAAPHADHVGYVPHAHVATWTRDGTPAAAYGSQLHASDDDSAPDHVGLRFHRRMARREARGRLRFLPLHLAVEGYLALHFGGPTILWEQWSHRAVRQGLSPRAEAAYHGARVPGLEDALRIFEIHPGQCGVLIYAADALAAACVVPHPADYRALHATLVNDLFGELIHHYAHLSGPVPRFCARLDDTRISSLADVRARAAAQRDAWAAFGDEVMAGGLLGPDTYTFDRVHRMGRFALWRFLPDFHRGRENHIGESITDAEGRLAYLTTYRLSEAQTRRGRLLSRLAEHDWNIPATAAVLNVTETELGLRLDRAGFGHLLRSDVLDAYRARRRHGTA